MAIAVGAGDRVAHIESLLEELESLPDPVARAKSTEAVQALLDFYGQALSRLVDHVAARDDGSLAQAVTADDLVSHLLLLHGLHPVPVEERVRAALDEVAPYLRSHGGGVELVAVQDGVAKLRLEGSCSGCPSSRVTLKLAVEEAVMKAAPDLEGIEADGATPAGANGSGGLLQIEMADPLEAQAQEASWTVAGTAGQMATGGPQMRDVRGQPVLFLRVGGEDYAYRPQCPSCHGTIGEGDLSGGEIACGHCRTRYDVRRAGLGIDAPDLQLEPVPLLVDDRGQVTVALGGGA
jgi:Fe-S cluster biogenesis protein NfuA/nitrite reductase/ring-hydroxylating ferredoxin subunit